MLLSEIGPDSALLTLSQNKRRNLSGLRLLLLLAVTTNRLRQIRCEHLLPRCSFGLLIFTPEHNEKQERKHNQKTGKDSGQHLRASTREGI
jgi:hypothetical protein